MLSVDHKLANPSEKQRIENCGVKVNEGQTRLSGLGGLTTGFCAELAC